jgi:hypothetical protein
VANITLRGFAVKKIVLGRFKFFKPENKAIGKMRETHECMGVPMSLLKIGNLPELNKDS